MNRRFPVALSAAAVVAPLLSLTTAPTVARADGPTCEGRPATIVGTSGDDALAGTDRVDVIVARGGDDSVAGRGGADVICAGLGNDAVQPGPGEDVVRSGPDRDWVWVNRGDTVWTGGGVDGVQAWKEDASIWLNLGAGDDQVELKMPDGGAVYAGTGDDYIGLRTTYSAPMSLVGGAGEDILDMTVDATVPLQPVELDGQAGTMSLGGPSGDFGRWEGVFLFGEHHWAYHGSDVSEAITVDRGPIDAWLYGGDDTISLLSSESDYINGGHGSDFLDAAGGDDHVVGGPGLDFLEGGPGIDVGDDPVPPNGWCSGFEEGTCVED